MATTEPVLSFSVLSVVEDVLKQHGSRLSDFDLASRMSEEASLRRNEAAEWLRKMIGVVGGKDLPAEPSEEEFRLGLRSGIILCNVLNKVQSGAVPKVVEGPCDSVVIPDGAVLSAYQYFENVRNFLVAVEEMGLPTFEASDLEQGGKSSRVVNCVLALKSYSDWKQGGKSGSWKFSGNLKPTTSGKHFVWKNTEPFMNSSSRAVSMSEKSLDGLSSAQSYDDLCHDLTEPGTTDSLNMLVRAVLSDKKREEIPLIVESMLSKVMEEFQHRLASQNKLLSSCVSSTVIESTEKDMAETGSDMSLSKTSDEDLQMEEEASPQIEKEECYDQMSNPDEESKCHLLKQWMLVEQQQRDIQELKHTLHTTKEGMMFLKMKYHEEFNTLGKHLHGLAHAASGYQRVLEENRKLYNQVQDLKGNIRVYCRVRPLMAGQANCSGIVDHIEEGNISITTPYKYGKEGRKSFTFNKVFAPSATQEEVFTDTQPLIRSVLDGFNVCIFAYGQTGSGKTYTMTGPKELTEESLGVNYRALSDLFLLSEQRKDIICYDVSVQMIEIYNEQVRDLLVTDGANKRLEIRNSTQNGINVPDANLVPVSSPSDVLYLMNLGHSNRAVSATAMNDRSSRSHSCLTVHVQGRDVTSGNTLRGCMHLVDLAGSERVDKSEVLGDRLKEAQHINKSLSALGDVIASLAHKNAHVPYRNSKLTQLLQDSLGGQAKTLMFVHISPEHEAIGETLSTLKFAERVSTVELGAARANKDGAEVKELKEQIASLKAALARKEGEHSQSSTPERFRLKSTASSPSRRGGDMFNDRKNSPVAKPRRQSFDLHELLMNSPPWTPDSGPGSVGKDDDRESISGDWVDKVMVNKNDRLNRGENSVSQWEGDNRQLPEIFYGNRIPDPSKIYPEQPYYKHTLTKKDSHEDLVQRNRYEMVSTTDDSDELEVATSDSSEPEQHWQSNLPRVNSIPNGSGSKMKKNNAKPTKNQETRSFIPSLIPSPSRKLPNGVSSPLQKPGRQPVHGDGKRRTGNGK